MQVINVGKRTSAGLSVADRTGIVPSPAFVLSDIAHGDFIRITFPNMPADQFVDPALRMQIDCYWSPSPIADVIANTAEWRYSDGSLWVGDPHNEGVPGGSVSLDPIMEGHAIYVVLIVTGTVRCGVKAERL